MNKNIFINKIIKQQREFFNTGKTKEINFRIQQLKTLRSIILAEEKNIIKALKEDLHKPELESYLEISILKEINYALKNIKRWCKPQKVNIPLEQIPATGKIYPEPLGLILIISPWNYPFSLTISPLIGAIASGNCAILKPSEFSPATTNLISTFIKANFDPAYISIIEGDATTSQKLLTHKFDHIFFTGSTKIGRIVMESAAQHLTPVTLELGGKSPCIVDKEINLKDTAKKITWGKCLNAGQSCIAPDYLLVHQSVKSKLIKTIQECIEEFYGENPALSPDFARIINQRQWQRLNNLLTQGKIIIGGETNQDSLYIAPTLIEPYSLDTELMEEEIFGPILPIIEYNDLEEAIAFVNNRPKPLALYFFSQDKTKQQRILRETSSGGVGLNETMMHFGVIELPFGGVGMSGIGSYHGQATFKIFSHYKSVLSKPSFFNINWRYPPYQRYLKLVKIMSR